MNISNGRHQIANKNKEKWKYKYMWQTKYLLIALIMLSFKEYLCLTCR